MVLKSKLIKITVASLTSMVLMVSGLGATRAYYKATSTPVVDEVEKTDKQALAVELATSESYQDMLAKSKKKMKENHKKELEKLTKDLEEKEKKEKEAEDKAKQEEEQRVLAEQEELRLAEEQRILAEQEAQQKEVYTEQTVQEPVQQVAKQEVQASVQEPIQQTNGFNYLGNHYDISSFSGSGNVPHWTNSVYQWSDYPKHYLVERQSYAGQTITSLTVGTQVIKNGQTFTVYDIAYNQDRQTAQSLVYNNNASMTIQVCATDDAESDLHIYFLR